ncbi:helix-turn-helix domain-containing protein [Corynebacterium bouchesdurhonense]|uniref:helix-turn-helix domain-containing protein n=1 Tax=Corynebacterium bouchesdurhonense TaxID=1720192 RepID=UPI00082D3F7E|nr:helix-turn-helix domain-containing protein [Corynebacterium bouchesdurhonense]
MGSKEIPAEVRREAVARVAAGEMVAEVASSLGVTKHNVWRWLRKAGVPAPKNAKAAANDALFVEAKKLLALGMSQAKAAQMVGMDPGALCYRLRQESPIAVAGVKNATAQEREYALTQVRAGRSPYHVAKEIGRSAHAVYVWMGKAGVQGPRGSQKHFTKKRAEALVLANRGWRVPQIADTLSLSEATVYLWLKNEAMTITEPRVVSTQPSQAGEKVGRGTRLSTVDRIRIAEGIAAGRSIRAIGRDIGRDHTVVKREIERNAVTCIDHDGAVTTFYNVEHAEELTAERKRRPKPRKIDVCLLLRQEVLAGLARRWSPKRIERRLRSCYPDDGAMHISHESI